MEIPLEPPALGIARLDDASARRSELLLGAFPLGDIETDADDVLGLSVGVAEHRIGPQDQPSLAVPRDPMVLVRARRVPRPHAFEGFVDTLGLLGWDEEVEKVLATHLLQRVSGQPLALPVESHQVSVAVEGDDQDRSHVDEPRRNRARG